MTPAEPCIVCGGSGTYDIYDQRSNHWGNIRCPGCYGSGNSPGGLIVKLARMHGNELSEQELLFDPMTAPPDDGGDR